MNGIIKIGLTLEEIKALAQTKNPIKVSPRNIAIAVRNGWCGGTTVAGTLQIAAQVVLAFLQPVESVVFTLHSQFDVSSDLPLLSKTRIIVVCSGAKAILDIQATLEVLETYGVTGHWLPNRRISGFLFPEKWPGVLITSQMM